MQRNICKLHEYCAKGCTEKVEQLVNSANINLDSYDGWRAIERALASGHVNTAKYLTSKGAKVQCGWMNICVSAVRGGAEAVKFVLLHTDEEDKSWVITRMFKHSIMFDCPTSFRYLITHPDAGFHYIHQQDVVKHCCLEMVKVLYPEDGVPLFAQTAKGTFGDVQVLDDTTMKITVKQNPGVVEYLINNYGRYMNTDALKQYMDNTGRSEIVAKMGQLQKRKCSGENSQVEKRLKASKN